MDNVTHSLAGLLLAEGAVRMRASRGGAESSPRFRTGAAIISMIAANLPDADLFYTGIGADKLRYLLHHRGYTHTVIGALIGALLLWGIASLIWRWRTAEALTSPDARWLLGIIVICTLSHLVLDATNSYGVHPFWPIDNRWRYGDAVFIVEPWLWVVSVPALFAASRLRFARVLLAMVLVIGLLLAWRVGLVSRGAATSLTVGAALSVGVAWALQPTPRVTVAIGSWIALTLLIVAASREARAAVLDAVHTADSTAEVLDVVVSALPANVVCMTAISVERSRGTYHVVTAQVSVLPTMTDASRCGVSSDDEGLLQRSRRRSTSKVHWQNEWSAPASELAALANQSCAARAALRFIRVPIWRSISDSLVVLGDVRYGGGTGSGFSDVTVARRSPVCPAHVPPWTPPRSELLAP
jgi:inner membrane protein